MVLYPFKKQEVQSSFGFISSLVGLLIVAIGFNSSSVINLFNIKISYTVLGFIVFIVGLFYFVESLSK